VTSEGRNEEKVVAAGIVNRGEFQEKVRQECRHLAVEKDLVEVFAFLIGHEAGGVEGFFRAKSDVAGEEEAVEEVETVANVGQRRKVGMTFKVEFGRESSDMIHDIIDDESSIELYVNVVIVTRIQFHISGEVHSTEVVCVGGRNGNIIVLKDDRSELASDCGEGGGGADFDGGDARGGLNAGSLRHGGVVTVVDSEERRVILLCNDSVNSRAAVKRG
jgi:hypothetical protein